MKGARKPIWRCSHLQESAHVVEKFPGGKDAFGVLPKHGEQVVLIPGAAHVGDSRCDAIDKDPVRTNSC